METATVRVDELLQFVALVHLAVAVDQERGVLRVRQSLVVQRLQIRRQAGQTLRVQEPADHVGGLENADGLDVLRDGFLVVLLRVEIVAVSTWKPSSDRTVYGSPRCCCS